MKKVALTGSIGMGKSTIAAMFKKLGVKVFCADEAVHKLYKKGGAALNLIVEEFGDILNENGDIDREKLSISLANNSNSFKRLEAIVHPLVADLRNQFINENKSENFVIFDIPLLFETKAENNFDKVILVDCDYETQKKRVLSRPNMNEEKLAMILKNQLPNELKKQKADFVIETSKDLAQSEKDVAEIFEILSRN